MVNLGLLLEDGKGGPKDWVVAKKMVRQGGGQRRRSSTGFARGTESSDGCCTTTGERLSHGQMSAGGRGRSHEILTDFATR